MVEKKNKKEEFEWDIKKIFIVLALIVLVLFVGVWLKRGIFAEINSQKYSIKNVDEVSDVKKAVDKKINQIQTDAENINFEEIATSSPQVQKVIKDLKSLESYPSSQARSMCEKICSEL